VAHLQPNLFKQILEHFFKQDFGPKEKKQLFSDQHFSTQDSIFWVVHCTGTVGHLRPVIQTGQIPASSTITGLISPHESPHKRDNNKIVFFILLLSNLLYGLSYQRRKGMSTKKLKLSS